MNDVDDVVRARVSASLKESATSELQSIGVSVSEAIRRLLVHVAREGRLPSPLDRDSGIYIHPAPRALKTNRRA
ncbi:MAG: type II toxin-antitoxin system RelB/DinJ family antitoxin, partial [Hyphomicrobium sp.]|nr:type II toxin-antitoxin system RelB/DinJ family antitoxin [Hyphomicrobium sp.]